MEGPIRRALRERTGLRSQYDPSFSRQRVKMLEEFDKIVNNLKVMITDEEQAETAYRILSGEFLAFSQTPLITLLRCIRLQEASYILQHIADEEKRHKEMLIQMLEEIQK